MKVALSQLPTHLNKALSAIYVITGDDVFLKQETAQLIRQAVKKSGNHEQIKLTLDDHFNWEQFYTVLYSESLLSTHRFLELDFQDTTPPKPVANLLQTYASNPSPNVILLIKLKKIDTSTAKTAWYQSLEKAGTLITIWPLSREQLLHWVRDRAKQSQLSLSQDALHLLIEYVEGNHVAAAQTLEKLALYAPTKMVDASLIQTILSEDSRYSIFYFIDSFITSDLSRTLKIFNHLKAEGTEPILLLWGMIREFRLMARFAQKQRQGYPLTEIFQKERVFQHRQALVRQFLNRHTAHDCWHYLTQAAEIDRLIKGVAMGQIWEQLELFCVRVAKHAATT
jgi:DNA polymerase-3 subunit delta